MKINICNPVLPDISDIHDQFSECLSTGQVTNNGKYVQAFEEKLQEFLGSRLKPVCFCNGEMALFNLIRAYKIKYNIPNYSNVLVPSFTFVGTINAIVANNLKPIFCEVDETLTMQAHVTGRTINAIRLIVGVGVYGNLPGIMKLDALSELCNCPFILDAAPTFGSKYRGEYPDKYCDCIYSFHATKTFTTMEGGCSITNDQQIYDLLVQLRDFGQTDKTTGEVIYPGLNSKMMEICGIIGLHNLKNYPEQLEKKKVVIEKYNEFFKDLPVRTMKVSDDVFCNYLYYPIILKDFSTDFSTTLNHKSKSFIGYMATNGIQIRRYYTACHMLTAYCEYDKIYHTQKMIEETKSEFDFQLPFTNSLKDRIVALPIHSNMTDSEINYLFDTIKNYFK